MHHDAHTLMSVTAPLKSAASMPGNCLPSRVSSPGTAGMFVSGAGWPIRAEGMRDGSPEPRRKKNKAASARKKISGNRRNSRFGFCSETVALMRPPLSPSGG